MVVDVPRIRNVRAHSRSVTFHGRAWLLPLLVTASSVVSALVAFRRSTPRFFPDEFLYTEIARSLAAGHGVKVLSDTTHFPPLLESILTSPAWLPGDPVLGFRLVQLIHAVVMSLAAVPVFKLATKLGVRFNLALAAAVAALVSPDLLYVGYGTADALGYTLALCAVLAAVTALSEPSGRNQAIFLLAAGVASFARLQYVVLVPAVFAATLLVERGSLVRAARRYRIMYGTCAVGGLLLLAAGSHSLGRYSTVTGFRPTAETLQWIPISAFLLALAAGVAIVPGALAWISSSLRKPLSSERLAFASLLPSSFVFLLVASAVMAASTGSGRFFERYLMILIPLVAVAFVCWVEDGRPARYVALGTAAVIIAAAPQVPAAGYAQGAGQIDSAFLQAVGTLRVHLGIVGASLAVAGLASAGAVLGALAAVLGRRVAIAALAVSLLSLSIVSFEAHVKDIRLSDVVAAPGFAGAPNWVDNTGERNVLLVQTLGSQAALSMNQAFWNNSVTAAARLGGAAPMDGADRQLAVRGDGTLLLAGKPVTRPVLVAVGGTQTRFANALRIGDAQGFELMQPRGGPLRLTSLVEGMSQTGWLALKTTVRLWPAESNRCAVLTLGGQGARSQAVDLDVQAPGQTARKISISHGRTMELRLPVPAGIEWHATVTANRAWSHRDGTFGSVPASLEIATLDTQGTPTACR